MAGAMRNLVGITPDYVVVSRFPFFEDMVDDIGGITVDNPRRFRDPYLKKEGFAQGRIRLGGYDAMAFSRIRYDLPGGDFDRSANQQRTLRGIHARIRSQADRPGFIERGVMTVMKHLSTDLGPAELYELAQAVAQVEPGRITTCVIRGRIGTAAARAWCSLTSPRPAGWATPPVATPPCAAADLPPAVSAGRCARPTGRGPSPRPPGTA